MSVVSSLEPHGAKVSIQMCIVTCPIMGKLQP